MTPDWLPSNIARPVLPPLRSWPRTRSAEALIAVVGQFQVETAERYRLRDVTGDGKSESWCNVFAADVCDAMGAPIPNRMLANQLCDWLGANHAAESGWRPTDMRGAVAMVAAGCPVLACWRNVDGAPGHIAVGVPSADAGLHVAQAGRQNFSCRPVTAGFGHLPVKLFFHP